MVPIRLIKGKVYWFDDPTTGKTEMVKYVEETINHWVFVGDGVQAWITSETLKTSIHEMTEDGAPKM